MAMRCAAIAFAQRSWAKVLVVVGKSPRCCGQTKSGSVFFIYIYVLHVASNYSAVIYQSVLHVILPQIAQITLIFLMLSLVYQRQCRR